MTLSNKVSITVLMLGVSFIWFRPEMVSATASMGVSPATGTMTVGDTKTVAIAINTGGLAVNSAQATVSFSTSQLEVVSMSKGSIFSLWTAEPTYSNSTGTVSFSGGAPSPGYNGHGTIISITFRAKATGIALITITGGSVLANDGFGTNVYGGAGGASYTINAIATTPSPKTQTSEAIKTEPETAIVIPIGLAAAPIISSTTHPEIASWYSNSNPQFSWLSTADATQYSWLLDHQSDTVPDDTNEGPDTTVEFTSLEDGTWYLHVKAGNAAGWGETSHYRVQIDTAAPADLIMNLDDGQLTKKNQLTLRFYTQDTLSGLAYYYVLIDGKTHLKKITPEELDVLELPTLPSGAHTITIQAYDSAGNMIQEAATIKIMKEWPSTGIVLGGTLIYYKWIVSGLMVVVIILIGWLFIFFFTHRKKNICIDNCHVKTCPHYNHAADKEIAHCKTRGRSVHHKKLKKLK